MGDYVSQSAPSIPARAAIAALRGYKRWISPWLPPACRFYPTCSVYAIEAISSFGFVKGGWLALKRIVKCHPLHPGGVDLPPNPQLQHKPLRTQPDNGPRGGMNKIGDP